MPLIQFLQVILRPIHWELCTHVYIFQSVLSLKDVVKSWKFNVEGSGEDNYAIALGELPVYVSPPCSVSDTNSSGGGGCPHYRWEGNDLWAQQDRRVNPYWKLSIVKIWSPINIVQVIMHLSNEKPSRQVGVSPWPPRWDCKWLERADGEAPLWILVMCIWLCQLIPFLKLNVMCWKILSWWINELKEVLIFE